MRSPRSLKPPSYTRLLVRPISPTEWRVERAWVYDSPRETIVVPEGMTFDGASVPRLLRWFAQPMEPRLVAAALVHDLLYRRKPALNTGEKLRRIDADRVFLRILLEDGERVLRAWILFAAVRVGGWVAWRSHGDGMHDGTGA